MPRLYNKNVDGIPYGAVYIGRPSKWGNPFPLQGESSRNRVCDQFEDYVRDNPQLQADAKRELRGKDLVCFCYPKRCHGQTWLRYANDESEENEP